jgi:hypothetical protein
MGSFRPFRLIVILSLTLLVGACTLAETQVTSGGDFIAARPEWAARFEARPTSGSATGSVDRAVYDAARAEPLLRFPARIGLARIQNGALTSVPGAEADAWVALIRERGAGYGEFVAVSPLVAQLTAGAVARDVIRGPVDMVRIGAARQHLDAVLIYEVGSSKSDQATPLSLIDVTIIGAFLIPSRSLEGKATAAAMFVDVRNGYPYGTAMAQAEQTGIWMNAGSTERSIELRRTAEVEAVKKLTLEVATMMERLKGELDRLPAPRPARRG